MPLVEIIKGSRTGDEAVARAFDLVRQIGKTPIVVNDSRGFFTSRVIGTYIREGHLMLTDGVPRVIEFNCRFGDPETQVLMPRVNGDFARYVKSAADGALEIDAATWSRDACVGVVLARSSAAGIALGLVTVLVAVPVAAIDAEHHLIPNRITGPAADVTKVADPLLRGLLDSGLIRPDPHRLGLDVGPGNTVLVASGRPSHGGRNCRCANGCGRCGRCAG